MKSVNKSIAGKYLAAILSVICFLHSSAQSPASLSIGDKAPELKYSRWLQGTPVKAMEGKRLYVIEFWATWCSACIAAMPHLSDLAEKYKDQATFIGVNVWEKTDGKPYESVIPAVTRFVKANARRMRYNVIVDNNKEDMMNLWIKPAKIIGIPMTVVVKNGTIAWIGHPVQLDKVLDPIIADTFDIAAFKKSYEGASTAFFKAEEQMNRELDAIRQATAAKDFGKAFQLIDEGLKRSPKMAYIYKSNKFRIMLDHFPETEVLQYATEWSTENNRSLRFIAEEILNRDGLSKQTYLYAAGSFAKYSEKDPFSGYFHSMAKAYAKAGDLRSAVEAEEKAISMARAELKDPKFEGRVFDYTIEDYERALDEYKKPLK